MVAIVSGNGIGLTLASLAGLGKNNATMGQGSEAAYVNIANGNLVLQDRDDRLTGSGAVLEVVRTYNSQGLIHDDNADNWWINGYRRIANLTGTANNDGSTVQRLDADGSALTYRYDAASGIYLPDAASGRHDMLTYDQVAGQWTWTEAATQRTETYEANASGWRLRSAADANGNTLTYSYANGLLSSIVDGAGEAVEFVYDGNQLMQERVRQADGSYLSRTSYAYDSDGRLYQVKVDLSPSDNDASDGNVYVTSYSYTGDTNLVSGILQSDGTRLTLSYDDQKRVSVMIDSLGRATRFSYDATNRTTTVTDALGNASVYRYDEQNRLAEATGPQIDSGARHVTYTYDTAGNLAQLQDAQGNTVTRTYDAHGNVLTETDGVGNRIERTYDADNRVLTQALYQGTGVDGQAAPEVTRYVYDAHGNLRFTVGADGDVAEYRYDSHGQRITAVQYPAARYDASALAADQFLDMAAMSAWSATQDPSSTSRTDYQWNVRGLLVHQTVYTKVDANGNGIADGTESVTQYAYDAAGRLLMQIDPDGNQTSYAYDGLGRLLSNTDALGHVTLNQYDDANHVVRHIQANGRVDADIYDSAGELLSKIVGGQVQASYRYDDLGRMVMSIDGTGVMTFYQYDAAGNLQFQIDGNGSVTEYVYNALNQRVQTIQYTASMLREDAFVMHDGQLLGTDSSTNNGTQAIDQLQSQSRIDVATAEVSAAQSALDSATAAQAAVDIATTSAPGKYYLQLMMLYLGLAGQPPASPDTLRASYWANYLDKGTFTLGNMASSFYWDSGPSDIYARFDDTQFINYVYQNAFGRSPTAEEEATWLQSEASTGRPAITLNVLNAVANYTGTDSLLLQSRAFLDTKLSAALQAIGWGAYDATSSTKAVSDAQARLAAALNVLDAAKATPDVSPMPTTGFAQAGAAWNSAQRAIKDAQAGYDQARVALTTAIAAQAKETDASDADRIEGTARLQVMRLYVGCFGTSPATVDALQMPRWLNYISNGATFANIANTFYYNAGPLEYYDNVDNAGFIDAVYRNVFGRSPSDTEANTWLAQFESSIGHARGEVALDILNAAANYDGNDSTLLADKAALAQKMSDAFEGLGWTLYDPAAAEQAVLTATRDVAEWDAQLQSALVQLQTIQPVWTQQIAKAVGPTQLEPAAPAAGPSTWTLFDAAGHLAKSIDALGHVTAYQYDAAGNRIAQIAYATPIDTSVLNANTRAEQVAVTASSDDRATYFYYDADNRLIGQVDPEGYVLHNVYDAAGRLTETVHYASRTSGQPTASADFATLIPSAVADDQHTYRLYDGQGRAVGEVDAEGYLTEQQYDATGNVTASIRYANRVTATVTAASTLASVRPAASAQDQATYRVYDAGNRLVQSTDATGTVTQYAYDAMGNLVGTTTAAGTAEAATASQRFDVMGRLTGSLSGIGSALLAQAQTPDQVQAVWAQYGTTYEYDVAGRRISTTDPAGNKTLFYYDAAGRLTYTINALGEVQQRRYDALGRLEQTARYATRLSSLTGLTGGLADSTLTNTVAGIADDARDVTTTYTYDAAGNLTSQSDALKAVTAFAYDAFGEAISRTQDIGDGRSLIESRFYDKRGLLTGSIADPGGINATTVTDYDAFGRAVRTVDANGNATRQEYDRLGRLVQTVDPRNAARSITYDAFDRVLTQTDALGRATSYAYDSTARSMTVTTAEGIAVTTVRNRQGQVQSVTDGNGNTTTYTYDRSGNLTRTDTPASHSSDLYDAAGRLIETVDANGNRVDYTYDAANRVLTRTLDPDGLNQVTRYEYDALGRRVSVTDPNGSITTTEYDPKGDVLRQTVDAAGKKLATTYTYNKRGRVLTVTSAGGSLTRYEYDNLGRRTAEHVDPDGLDLVTRYQYDSNGNAIARVDPNGHATRFVYDENNRLAFQIDPAGNVQRTVYDANGLVVSNTAFAKPISISDLPAAPSVADIQTRLIASPGQDVVQFHVVDPDGRLQFTVDGNGSVVRFEHDGNGNVTARIAYANRIDLSSWTPGSVPVVAADPDNDVVQHTIYDTLNRPLYNIDGIGAITERRYDANGNVLDIVMYAGRIPAGTAMTQDAVAAALVNIADPARDIHTHNEYDAVNRLVSSISPLGTPTVQQYDANGNIVLQAFGQGDLQAAATSSGGAGPQPLGQQASGAASAEVRTTRVAYDSANRPVYSVDPTGAVTQLVYDQAGNVVERIAYAHTISVSGAVTVNAVQTALLPDATLDRVSSTVYDAANRAVFSIDAMGNATEFAYDGAGNVVSSRAYSHAIDTTTLPANPAIADVRAALAKDDAHDGLVRMVYDDSNRLIYQVDAQGVVTQFDYSATGNVIRRTTYANPVALAGDLSAGSVQSALIPDAAHDHVIRTVYNASNRAIFDIDPAGKVTEHQYDSAGNAILQCTYAHAIQASSLPAQPSVVDVRAMLVSDNTADNVVRSVYDNSHQLIYQIDALGSVTEFHYDSAGRVTERVAYANPIGLSNAASIASVKAALQPDAVHDHASRAVYDADGNAIYEIDAQGNVTEHQYDSAGNVTATRAYAHAIAVQALGSEPAISTIQSLLARDDANDRVERTVYDADRRPLYKIDAQGFVTQSIYDAFGNVTKTIQYANAVPANTSLTPQGVATPLSISANDRVNTFTYDADGRLVASTDPLGATETYTYDTFGRKTSFTNKLGATWNYEYDADGRLVVERGPETQVSHVQATTDADGKPVLNIAAGSTRVETHISYDSFGNVIARTEAAGLPEERTTRYEYDAVGRQIRTIFPPVDVYAAANDNLLQNGAFGDATRIESAGVSLSNQVTYDALGNAVVNRDVAGNYSYKTYDSMGRVAYDVDAAGYVTGYTRDNFGNVTKLTRYAAPISIATKGNVPFTTSEIETALAANADHSADRSIRTQYDSLNRVTKVIEPQVYTFDQNSLLGSQVFTSGKVTFTKYNAFSEAISQSVFGENDAGLQTTQSEDTNFYYDARGNKIAQVTLASRDAGKQAYLSTMEYDAAGNLTRQVDYATPISSWSDAGFDLPAPSANDREIRYAYDADNHKVSETRVNISIGAADGTNTVGNATTSYSYDAVGNLVQTTDALGQTTLTYYDALGRVTAVASPTAQLSLRTRVAQLYTALLNRAPTPADQDFWVGRMMSGKSAGDIADEILTSDEAKTNYPAGISDTQFVTQVYQLVLNRAPDSAGLQFWASRLAGETRGQLVVDIIDSVSQHNVDPAARDWFNAKVGAVLAALPAPANALSPLTEFKLDAYGNVVRRIDYAGGATFAIQGAYQAAVATPDDRTTSTTYDSHGHAIETIDANGNASFSSYDEAGRLAKQWQTVTGTDVNGQSTVRQTEFRQMRYDARGQLVQMVEPGSAAAGQTPASVVWHQTAYNAFGEVTSRSVNGETVEYTDYDNAGHAWRTNAGDGIDKVNLFDAEGHVTAELRSADVNLESFASAQDAVNQAGMLRTETRYDLMGHAITQTMAARGVTEHASQLVSSYLTASVTNHATYQVSNSDSGTGGTWSGTNTVKLNWMPLTELGSGDVKVQIDYFSDPAQTGTSSDDNGNSVPVYAPESARNDVHVQILSSSDAANGATLIWSTAADGHSGAPSVDHISHIQVWKKDVSGQWKLVLDNKAPATTVDGDDARLGAMNGLLCLDAPTDPNTKVTLQCRQAGSNNPFQPVPLVNFGDKLAFDTSIMGEGSYEYQVLYQSAADAAPVLHEAGTFSVVSPQQRLQVAQLYVALFNRAPELAGLNLWVSILNSGASMEQVAHQMLGSIEAQPLQNASNNDFIQFVLRNVTGHDPDQASVTYWGNELNNNSRERVVVDMLDAVTSYAGGDNAKLTDHRLFSNKVAVALTYAAELGGNDPKAARNILAKVTATDTSAAIADAQAAAATEKHHTQLVQLYVALLNRAPDQAGLNFLMAQLASGATIADIASGMLSSDEAATLHLNTMGNGDFVSYLYRTVLGRDAKPEEVQFWADRIGMFNQSQDTTTARAQVALGIINAIASYTGVETSTVASHRLFTNKVIIGNAYAENLGGNDAAVATALLANVGSESTAAAAAAVEAAAAQANAQALQQTFTASVPVAQDIAADAAATPLEQLRTEVAQLYVALLGRAPEPAGLSNQVAALRNGMSLNTLASNILQSQEAQALYPPGMTDAAFITQVYHMVLNRLPDPDGMATWSAQLQKASRGAVAVQIINSFMASSGDSPAELQLHNEFSNKVAAALTYALAQGDNDPQAEAAIVALTTATSTASAVDAITASASKTALAAAMAVADSAAAAAGVASNTSTASDNASAWSNGVTAANAAAAAISQSSALRRVAQLYLALFNRTPDLGGLNGWAAVLSGGVPLTNIAQNLLSSVEGQPLAAMDDATFAGVLFQTVFNRAPDTSELSDWTTRIASTGRAQATVDLIALVTSYAGGDTPMLVSKSWFDQRVSDALNTDSSAAAIQAANANIAKQDVLDKASAAAQAAQASANAAAAAAAAVTSAPAVALTPEGQIRLQVTQLYLALLNRAPSLTDLNFWTSLIQNGMSMATAAAQILGSNEAQTTGGYPASFGDTQIVNRLYQLVLNRDATPEETAFWVQNIAASSRGVVVAQIINTVTQSTVEPSARLYFDTRVSKALISLTADASYASAQALNNYYSAANYASYMDSQAAALRQAANQAASTASAYAATASTAIASQSVSSANVTEIVELYQALLNRVPELAALPFWSAQINAGNSFTTLANNILNGGGEVLQWYQPWMTDQQFVTQLYPLVLGRSVDAASRDFWAARCASYSRGEVVWEIVNSVANTNGDPSAHSFFTSKINTALSSISNAQYNAISQANAAAVAASQASASADAADANAHAADLAASTANSAYIAANLAANATTNASGDAIYETSQATAVLAAAAQAAATAAATVAQSLSDAATQAATAAQNAQTLSNQLAQEALNAAAVATDAATAAADAVQRDQATAAANMVSGTPESLHRIQVTQLYLALLNRNPSLDEINFWVAQMQQQGKTRDEVADAMLGSSEEAQLYPDANADAFLDHLYATILNRAPDAPGRQFWKDLMAGTPPMSRATVVLDMIDSISYSTATDSATLASKAWFNRKVAAALTQAATTAQAAIANSSALSTGVIADALAAAAAQAASTDAASAVTPTQYRYTQLTQLYALMFNRKPDLAGIKLWIAQMDQGQTLTDVAQGFLASGEWHTLTQADGSTAGIVTRIWQNALGRSPSANELSYWSGRLDADPSQQGAVYIDLLQSVRTGGDGSVAAQISATLFNNQVALDLSILATDAAAQSATLQLQAARAKAAADAAGAIAQLTLPEPAVLLKPDMSGTLVNGIRPLAIPVIHRSYDRWGNVLEVTDARNPAWKTTYTYNASNQVTSEQKPGDADGPASLTQFYYDVLGRNVAERDARGNVNGQRYDAQGNVAEETHADGGHVSYTYDLFGDRLQQNVLLKDGSVQQTAYGYDHLGHLTSVTHGAVDVYVNNGVYQDNRALTETYTYDELGRRITATDGAGATTTTAYDLRGNVVRVTDALNRSTVSGYDAFNHKVSETDALGRTMTWQVDAQGKVLSHVDLGGHTTLYQYNNLGLQTTLHDASGHGQDLRYTYDEAGLLVRVDNNATGQVTTYAYDLAGNRVREKTVALDPDSQAAIVVQDNHLQYDAQGRLATVDDGRYHIHYDYDASGNRIHEASDYINDAGVEMKKETWSVYDQMNRATIVDGVNHGGTIELDPSQGHAIAYDYNGNRLSDTYYGKRIITGSAETPPVGFDEAGNLFYGYDANGQEITSPITVATREVGTGMTTEAYNYDADGRLTNVYRDGIEVDRRHYDAAGRAVASGLAVGGFASDTSIADKLQQLGVAAESRTYGYDAAGQVAFQVTYNIKGEPTSQVDYHYDNAGRLASYSIHVPKGDATYDDFYTYHYDLALDSDKVTRIDLHTTNRGDAATTNSYDVDGNLVRVSDTTGLNRAFINDAAGRILQKSQDGKRTHTLIANGEVVGSSDDSIFDSINTAYVPANTGGTAPSSYTVQANDTLQGIAKAVWGDATLWYLIADANGLDGSTPLTAGQVINLPARPNAVHNNAATFKPYDASEAVGNTALDLPMPTGSDGCGGMGQIIMIAVAVAVTLYTAGALSGAAGSIGQVMSSGASFLGGTATAATETVGMSLGVAGTGAVAGAAGSIASQVVGNAIGAEDGFNWNQVALGAIAGGVAGGLSGWTPAGGNIYGLGNVAARAAVGSVMTQGIDVVTGLQDHFSWAAVAASAAGAGVSNGSAAGLQDTAFAHAFGSLGVGTLAGFAGGVVAAGLNGGRISAKQVATDAFGNALGNSIADGLGRGSQQTGVLYSADEQAQDFARENNRFASAMAANASDPANIARAQWLLENGVAGPGVGIAQLGQDRLKLLSGGGDDVIGAQQAAANRRMAETRMLADELNALKIQQAIANGDSLAPTVANAARLGLYDTSGDGMPVKTAYDDVADLAGRFGKGVVHGAADIVWQPIANTIDLGQVAVGLISGGRYEPTWLSGIGQNYQAGMSYGETVTRAVLGSNPVTGVGLASYDLTGSALKGDWGGVAEGAGGLAGGFAAGKYGQRFFAPEPGAQLGIYRMRPEIEVTNPLVDPGGLLPPLPGAEAKNFTSVGPVFVGGKPLYRVFDNIDAYPNGRWWADQPIPATESAWRSGYAVTKEYNQGTYQATTTPEGQWAWGGKAAPQAIEGFSDKFNLFGSTYRYGWIQPGGKQQIFIHNARDTIPSSSISTGSTLWNK